MMLWQCTPAALMKRDCFLLSWNCYWLLFEMPHCVQLAQLSTGRSFIKTQIVCQGRSFYCHWFVHYNIVVVLTVIVMASSELNAPALPGENGDAFCLFTSAEQHSENVSYYCLSNQYYISQSEC